MHKSFRDRKRNGYIRHPDLGMRYKALRASKDPCRIIRRADA